MDGKHDCKHSAKLIRCNVTNHSGEQSVRHIYLDEFLLWEHLMVSRHQVTVGDISLCLWVPEGEFSRNENIYQHTANLEMVNRIVVDLYDPENGFSNTITRFVMRDECERVREIILSHIPADRRKDELCEVSVVSGTCVQKYRHCPDKEIILGMYV